MTLALVIRILVSAIIIALIALVSKRSPGLGGLIASLPLVSTLGMIWLWVDTHDAKNVADYTQSAFWFFLPTMPMFLIIPWMLRHDWNFWASLTVGLGITIALYLAMIRLLVAYGINI